MLRSVTPLRRRTGSHSETASKGRPGQSSGSGVYGETHRTVLTAIPTATITTAATTTITTAHRRTLYVGTALGADA